MRMVILPVKSADLYRECSHTPYIHCANTVTSADKLTITDTSSVYRVLEEQQEKFDEKRESGKFCHTDYIRGADNPAANNPKNPDFREKKKEEEKEEKSLFRV